MGYCRFCNAIADIAIMEKRIVKTTMDEAYILEHEYISKKLAMTAACKAFCRSGSVCADGFCKEVRDAFDMLPVVFIEDGKGEKSIKEEMCENCGYYGGCCCDYVDVDGNCLGWKPIRQVSREDSEAYDKMIDEVAEIMKNVKYHLSCDKCLKTWWSKEAFPEECPYCHAKLDDFIITKASPATRGIR